MLRRKIVRLLVCSMLPALATGVTFGKYDRFMSGYSVTTTYFSGNAKNSGKDVRNLKSESCMLSLYNSLVSELEEVFKESSIKKENPVTTVTTVTMPAETTQNSTSATESVVTEPVVTTIAQTITEAEVTTVTEEIPIIITEPVEYLEPEIQHAVVDNTVASPPLAEEIDDSDITCSGIDVSRWQGTIDWQRIKNAGVQFAIIKAGEGTEVESKFYENINGAKAAGINCGVYWFSNAKSVEEAVMEAQACLDTISGYQLEYPVVCDFEYRSLNNNPLADNKTLLTDTVIAFLNTIQSNGYYSMFYTNLDFSGRYLEFERISDNFDIWCAGYSIPEPNMPCGMWQYSQTGEIDGTDITGLNGSQNYVDLDISYKNYPAKMKKYHLNGY